MTTRFEGTLWNAFGNRSSDIRAMGTDHLLNIAKMLYTCPEKIVGMMVCDIERQWDIGSEYVPGEKRRDLRTQSLHNITCMSAKELIEYVFHSTFGAALKKELSGRGVNLSNVLSFCGNPFNVQLGFDEELMIDGAAETQEE